MCTQRSLGPFPQGTLELVPSGPAGHTAFQVRRAVPQPPCLPRTWEPGLRQRPRNSTVLLQGSGVALLPCTHAVKLTCGTARHKPWTFLPVRNQRSKPESVKIPGKPPAPRGEPEVLGTAWKGFLQCGGGDRAGLGPALASVEDSCLPC